MLALFALTFVRAASAEGINLSWNDCGAAGTSVYSIACDGAKGIPPTLVASFIPPAGVNHFVGASAEMLIESSTPELPDWWKHGVGQCRGTGGIATSFDFTSGPSTCADATSGLAFGGYAYDVHWQGASAARLRVQYAIPADSPRALSPTAEYYAFKASLLPGNAGTCVGCETPVRITLQGMQLFQPLEYNNDPEITNTLLSTSAFWQGTPGPLPQIVSFNPATGAPGIIVTIHGANLSSVSSVRFGGESAAFTVVSNEVITATVPELARSGKITVTSFSGFDGSDTDFIVAPAITSFSPTLGPVATRVEIHGRNFEGATAVRFNGVDAIFTRDPGYIVATVPAGATSGSITVVTPAGTAQSATSFTVTLASQPIVNGFTPAVGRPGLVVTVNGSQFTGATLVGFGGTSATFTVSSDAVLVATVPIGARTGPITVSGPGGTGRSVNIFMAAPVIESFSPNDAAVGSIVSLHGYNFTGTTAVQFNGRAASFAVPSDTLIRATVPDGTTNGPIVAVNPGGAGSSPIPFRVGATSVPRIDNVAPGVGYPGALVAITGRYFEQTFSVRFGGVAAAFEIISGTFIRAIVPTGGLTGPITITTPAGPGESSGMFFVAPRLVSFEPRSGLAGTIVTLAGHNFTGATHVSFAGLDGAFVVANDSLIRATVPEGAASGALTVSTLAGSASSLTPFTVLSNEGPNLVRDGSFETSTAAWTPIGGATLARIEGGYDGAFALQLVGPDTTGEFGANDSPNTVAATPAAGLRYRFSAYVMKPAGRAHVELRAREYSNRLRTQTVTTGPITPDGVWRYLQCEIVSFAPGATIDFQIIATGFEPGVDVRFDQVAVRQIGNPPFVTSPAIVDATPGSPVEVVVTATDPLGGGLRALTADLSVLPEGNNATFTVDPGNARGVLRWTPEVEDGGASYHVEFRGASQIDVTSTTEIRVASLPSNLVGNPSFEDGLVYGWKGYRASSLERVPGGRTGTFALRVRPSPDSTGTYGINDSPNWVWNSGITAGKRYRVSCWVRGEARSGTRQIRIREYLGPAAVGVATYSPRLELTPKWTKIVVEHVTGAAGSTLDLHILGSPNLPTAEILIDDVSIREVAPPAMASRFGSREEEAGAVMFERPTVMPNPFRGRATLALALATRGPLRVGIYDVNGRRVRGLFDSIDAAAGTHRFELDGRDERGGRLTPGMFFYRIESARGVQHGRFVVLE